MLRQVNCTKLFNKLFETFCLWIIDNLLLQNSKCSQEQKFCSNLELNINNWFGQKCFSIAFDSEFKDFIIHLKCVNETFITHFQKHWNLQFSNFLPRITHKTKSFKHAHLRIIEKTKFLSSYHPRTNNYAKSYWYSQTSFQDHTDYQILTIFPGSICTPNW